MMDKVKKLKKTAEIEFTEKKSLFIALAQRIESEEEALEIIKQRKKKYYDATHNVYAYILKNGAVARYSDDAEPQGTAGMPVLNSIRMSGLTDVCVIVTRYFGGVLLGAGGLVRAYSTSASMALEAAGSVIYEPYKVMECNCSYSDYQKLIPILNFYEIIIDKTDFSEDVTLKCAISEEKYNSFDLKIKEVFSTRIKIKVIETRLDYK